MTPSTGTRSPVNPSTMSRPSSYITTYTPSYTTAYIPYTYNRSRISPRMQCILIVVVVYHHVYNVFQDSRGTAPERRSQVTPSTGTRSPVNASTMSRPSYVPKYTTYTRIYPRISTNMQRILRLESYITKNTTYIEFLGVPRPSGGRR